MRPSYYMMACRKPQNPNNVPFKVDLPLALRNRVTGKGSKLAERGCVQEIMTLLSCIENNNYENKPCMKEAKIFQDCYKTLLNKRHKAKADAHKGILTPNTRDLKYNQINILLRKYPHV